ncbi:actin family protein [Hibiscus syriacus]|uniref:RING-type E3 ubiquitin transferase n=1 Tax=Hibiscus syriacus TaxID=106335 RepID=A0A6A3C0C4_HIBSY|nr:actin family protein [Hibiscus syriacus]
MSASISTQDLQGLLGEFYSRRLLLPTPPFQTPSAAAPPHPETHRNSSDPYTSALRCARLVASESTASTASGRLPNRGVKRKALKTFPTVIYSADLNLQFGLGVRLCLSDFTTGDRVRLLPKCNHGFHVKCIDKWLSSHSSCPKCRHCLVETCQKIVGCSQASPSQPPAVQETVVSIPPVDREGLMHSYR